LPRFTNSSRISLRRRAPRPASRPPKKSKREHFMKPKKKTETAACSPKKYPGRGSEKGNSQGSKSKRSCVGGGSIDRHERDVSTPKILEVPRQVGYMSREKDRREHWRGYATKAGVFIEMEKNGSRQQRPVLNFTLVERPAPIPQTKQD
jgi:hypothetical protein